MSDNNLSKAVERLKSYHPDDWAARGIITKAKTGYICPNPQCRNGSGKDGTGATAKAGEKGWQVLCPVCGDGYDIIDTLGFYFNLSPQTQFIDIVKRGCQMFGVDIETGDADYKPDYKPEEKKIDYARIKKTITNAQKNLGNFFAKYGNPYRGIYRATFEDFGCGYDPFWYARKGAPLTPRLIIPSSWAHYTARLLGNLDDFNIPDGVHLGEKEHSYSPKPIFNFNRLKASDDPICFIVEGELDCMSIAQVTAKPAQGNKTAYPINVIAIAGIKLSPLMEEQLKSLPTKNFVVMLDNDDAGNKAAPILASKLKSLGHKACTVPLSHSYNDANDFLQANSNGLTQRIKELYVDAKGYFAELAVYEERNAKQKNTTSSVDTTSLKLPDLPKPVPNQSREEKLKLLFKDLPAFNVSAGAILQVAKPEIAAPLATLFDERNFYGFVLKVDENDSSANESNPNDDFIYRSDDEPLSTSDVQNKKAVIWLLRNLAPFFNGDKKSLIKVIGDKLKAAQKMEAVNLLRDRNFINSALANLPDETFHFDEKIKADLIAFASHSDDFLDSLIRFDFDALKKFLESPITDLACAELFIQIQHDYLRYAVDTAAWFVWYGTHWHEVSAKTLSEIYPFFTPIARKLTAVTKYYALQKSCDLLDYQLAHPNIADKNSVEGRKLAALTLADKNAQRKHKETLRLESNNNIKALVEQASAMPEVKATISDFDQALYSFNCANCTIDLKTMTTYPHKREDLITIATNTIYDPNATSKIWNDFVHQVLPDDNQRDWMQRYLGSRLCGDVKENLFVQCYGSGGGGKTTFLNAVCNAFGDYAQSIPTELITENGKQKDGNEASPQLAKLRAARITRFAETKKNSKLNEAFVKHLTGHEPITVRELYKPPYSFTPQFGLIGDGNFQLGIGDITDEGMRRRLRIIAFNAKFDTIDVTLAEKLAQPQVQSAILNWCLEGWIAYQQRGLNDIPTLMQKTLDSYYRSNDFISDFLETHDYKTADKNNTQARVKVSELLKAYNEWAQKTPMATVFKRTEFIRAFLETTKEDGIEKATISKQDWFIGLTLNLRNTNDNTP